MSDPAEQAKHGHEYMKSTYGSQPTDSEVGRYDQGGYIPGGATLTVIHPDDCLLNRDGVCARLGHPTSTSMCRR